MFFKKKPSCKKFSGQIDDYRSMSLYELQEYGKEHLVFVPKGTPTAVRTFLRVEGMLENPNDPGSYAEETGKWEIEPALRNWYLTKATELIKANRNLKNFQAYISEEHYLPVCVLSELLVPPGGVEFQAVVSQTLLLGPVPSYISNILKFPSIQDHSNIFKLSLVVHDAWCSFERLHTAELRMEKILEDLEDSFPTPVELVKEFLESSKKFEWSEIKEALGKELFLESTIVDAMEELILELYKWELNKEKIENFALKQTGFGKRLAEVKEDVYDGKMI